MAKISFNKRVKDIITRMETTVELTKLEGLQQLTKEAFGQVENKYIVKGNYATKKGSRLEYTSPPGANIISKRVIFRNAKTGFKKVQEIALFIKGKLVSRSGKYEKQISALANATYKKGDNKIGDVRVTVSKTGIKIFADDKSEVFYNEIHKQAGGPAIAPIFKSFRSVVSLWKRLKIKLAK